MTNSLALKKGLKEWINPPTSQVDSFYSNHSPGGYRKQPFLNLEQEGYRVDLVGTKSNNAAVTLPYSHHEGHNGWIIQDIGLNIEELLDKEEPDHVILVQWLETGFSWVEKYEWCRTEW
jgi:hypothetical protein